MTNPAPSLLSNAEISNENKEYKHNSKPSKGKFNRNTSKRARKTLLQEQQEVLEKNGKSNGKDNKDKHEGCKDKSDFTSDEEKTRMEEDARSGGGSLGNNGSHPRNRWRCMQPRVCNYCWKTFSNSFNLKQHIVNVHVQSQGVSCSLCEKVVKNKWYLRKHLVTAHGAPLKRVKGSENGGSSLGARDMVAPLKAMNADDTDSMDAAASIAAAAAAANIPLASFVAAATSISQQQNNINNNNSNSGSTQNIHGNGQIFPFSRPNFSSDANGPVMNASNINKSLNMPRMRHSKDLHLTDKEQEEEEEEADGEEDEEELIVDN